MGYLLVQADARAIPLQANSVDCVVTSPPYWGLRDYGVAGQVGLEAVHDCLGWANGGPCGECWVCQMVAVLREAWRVLKPWGTCWVNLGDSYSAGGHGVNSFRADRIQAMPHPGLKPPGLAPKQLCGIPWRFALAAQADGWWLRSEIIWHKPNPMPESIRDRPSKAHETIFLLAKSPCYFYDQEAVRRPLRPLSLERLEQDIGRQQGSGRAVGKTNGNFKAVGDPERGANLKTVWSVPTGLCKDAHFATFSEELIEPCILAGTSAKGNCPACGKPWLRLVAQTQGPDRPGRRQGREGDSLGQAHGQDGRAGKRLSILSSTLGWRPSCDCDAGPPIPALVLDPFVGSGTTCRAAERLGRRAIGLDLSLTYLGGIAARRCAAPLQPVLAGVL